MIACNLNEALYFCVRILLETQWEKKNGRTGGETTMTCSNHNSVVDAIRTKLNLLLVCFCFFFFFLLSSLVRQMPVRAHTRQYVAKDSGYQIPIPKIPSHSFRPHNSRKIYFSCAEILLFRFHLFLFYISKCKPTPLYYYCGCWNYSLLVEISNKTFKKNSFNWIMKKNNALERETDSGVCARSYKTMFDWPIAYTLPLSTSILPLDSHRLRTRFCCSEKKKQNKHESIWRSRIC